MTGRSPRALDGAVEGRWPLLFRYDLRQNISIVLAMQVVGLLLIVVDRPSIAAGPLAVSVGLTVRALLELKRTETSTGSADGR